MSAAEARKALKVAHRHARAALTVATAMMGRWDQECAEILALDLRQFQDVVAALGQMLAGDSGHGAALLAMEEACKVIRRERLESAIREARHRHGWGSECP
jgi:hypothetical protein